MKLTNSNQIPNIVKTARLQQNLSQRELSKKCGIGNATISRLESGQITNINIDTLFVILNTLSIELHIG